MIGAGAISLETLIEVIGAEPPGAVSDRQQSGAAMESISANAKIMGVPELVPELVGAKIMGVPELVSWVSLNWSP